ncbi:cation:dicarboxylase symporter family transporter [Metabacillus idriensis]|uniref:cation:dicarboxylate symporter family transporter n=1 Tax=Metabacillus idriensis TaxID=324768 RepID=UPI00203BC54C|nr:cation:dicarboxylase symporter family transporter [Metabacillus idriensis]MCM3598160.1 cation:dicarboxylase symporter family transporter [Metabacillus idriensis]
MIILILPRSLGLTVYVVITYGSMVSFMSNLRPIHFFRQMIPAMGTAFATSSSAASLPITKSLRLP